MDQNTIDILLIVIGCIVSVFIGFILYWSYLKSCEMFITTFLFINIIYIMLSLTYILIKQKIYSTYEYRINFGSDIFMAILSFILIIFFGSKGFNGVFYNKRHMD